MRRVNFFLFIILSTLLISCKGNAVDSLLKDANTGTYHLQGTKIDKRLCYVCYDPSKWGEVIEADTSEYEIDIGVEYVSGTTDSLRIWNLPGIGRGQGSAKIESEQLVFDLHEWGHSYTGTGYMRAGKISIQTTYQYRATEIEYDLTGEKIGDEVLR